MGTEVYTAYPPGYGQGTQVAIRSSTYINSNYKRVLDIMLDDTRSKSYDPNVNKFKQLLIDKGERVLSGIIGSILCGPRNPGMSSWSARGNNSQMTLCL